MASDRTCVTRPARAAAFYGADPVYLDLKARIIARTGHEYYADKDDQLIERLTARVAETGLSPDIYAAALADASADEWRALESAITINETFFFRFAEQFDLLRRTLLPRLIAAHGSDRRLRIWSVGCSTGAEPYSVAILLADLLGDAVADWQIAITGTDIDADALATARDARYSPWTLRTLGEAERTRLFERDGSAYRLKPRYRGMVRFERHNMMDLLDPAAALQFAGFDLILCRNVLIYFSHDVVKAMVGALAGRLAPDGHLFLGHAEPNPDFAQVAKVEELAGLVVYRRADRALDAAAPVSVPTPVAAVRPAVPPPPRPRPVPPRRTAQPESPSSPASTASLDTVRAALASGRAKEALQQAEEAARSAPADPLPRYMAGLGALALGDPVRAERGFREAIYLDTGFAMAHYLLGRHLLAAGRRDEGGRALANALRAVRDLPDDAELAEGDGMTAGALVRAARSVL